MSEILLQSGIIRLVGIVVAVGIGVLSVLVYASMIPAVWRGEHVPEPRGGKRNVRMNKRNWPVTAAAFLLLFGGIGVMAVADSLIGDGMIVGQVIAGIGIAGLLVGMFIDAVNRPKFLVPPDYRNDRGWLQKRFGSSPPSPELTNADVQEWFHNDPEHKSRLEGLLEDDLAILLEETDERSHYAVLDIWWSDMATDLGFEEPDEDEFVDFLIAIAETDAYQKYSDLVGEVPEIETEICGTSPFVVDHSYGDDQSTVTHKEASHQ
ncbi:hypothetical protein [Halocatena halophila]|uniref:hypothetical protein n=1 Tax=Halocatena halophila TaxID=2814576 RepID=UPI002ED3079C